MVTRNDSLWKTLDWVTIGIYLLLIVGGWFSVCGASYDYGDRDFLDFSTRAGKQFVWIICSFGLGFVLLMLEDRMYDMFAYIIYTGMIVLLIVTIFIAPDTKGSRSWLVMGPVSLQPAEFAKFATALALAKYMNSYSFSIKKEKCAFVLGFINLLSGVSDNNGLDYRIKRAGILADAGRTDEAIPLLRNLLAEKDTFYQHLSTSQMEEI